MRFLSTDGWVGVPVGLCPLKISFTAMTGVHVPRKLNLLCRTALIRDLNTSLTKAETFLTLVCLGLDFVLCLVYFNTGPFKLIIITS